MDTLTSSVDPDEMTSSVDPDEMTSHQGLHCLLR